jgi:16S rRNA (uracil1498-N3)-methyltransferase
MARRYYVNPLPGAGRQPLPADVAHHCARVLRRTVGEELLLFDGEDREASARIVRICGGAVEVEVGDARSVHREPQLRLEVAVALPKGNRAEWLFEHGTEVGIAAFRPIESARAQRAGSRSARWRRVVQAAAGQCDRSRVPVVHEPLPFAALLAAARAGQLPAERYVAAPDATPLGPARTTAALLLVGPEGGLAADELGTAADAGFLPRSLGPLTLRTETAALAGAVLLLHGFATAMPAPTAAHGTTRPRS